MKLLNQNKNGKIRKQRKKGENQVENQKWVLVKKSDGERGNNGLKKMYQVIVEDRKVITLWGKAEDNNQAKQVKQFRYSYEAKAYAYNKVDSKVSRGYEVVLVA